MHCHVFCVGYLSHLTGCVVSVQLDGFVIARSAFHHSANYRSVAIFGTGEVIRYVM